MVVQQVVVFLVILGEEVSLNPSTLASGLQPPINSSFKFFKQTYYVSISLFLYKTNTRHSIV